MYTLSSNFVCLSKKWLELECTWSLTFAGDYDCKGILVTQDALIDGHYEIFRTGSEEIVIWWHFEGC